MKHRQILPVFPPVRAAHYDDVLDLRFDVFARGGVRGPGAQKHGHDFLLLCRQGLSDAAKQGLMGEVHTVQGHRLEGRGTGEEVNFLLMGPTRLSKQTEQSVSLVVQI